MALPSHWRRRWALATLALTLVAFSASALFADAGRAEYGSDPRYVADSTITDVPLSGARRAQVWIEYNSDVQRLAGKLDVTWGTLDVARVFVQRLSTSGCGARPCEWYTVADFSQPDAAATGRILSTSGVTVTGDLYRVCGVVRDGGTQATRCSDSF